jgi:hypothetical protein
MKMFNWTKRRKSVLTDTRGISVSIPELMVSLGVRTVVITSVVAGLSVLLLLSASTSTSTSSSAAYQAASLSFKTDVANADFVKGDGTTAVALMSNTGSGCVVTTWRDISDGSTNTLVSDKTTLSVPCSATTGIPAPSATGRIARLNDVSANKITFANVAGRAITFDSTGNPSLATAAIPAGVGTQDWNDTRPQVVSLTSENVNAHASADAKAETLVGYTGILNYVQADPNAQYVNGSGGPIVKPVPPTSLKVARSPITGAVYQAEHEGVTVSFDGGNCSSGPTTTTVLWTPQTPAGQTPVSTTFSRVLTASTSVELSKVANGASGAVTVSAACDTVTNPATATKSFTQTVPNTVLNVAQGASAQVHKLSWSAVSSLPTSFRIDWSSTNGLVNGTLATTSGLSYTATQQVGSTYGFTTAYGVYPTVANISPSGSTATISNSWPAAPSASAIKYTSAKATNPIGGTISWTVAATCPAGTIESAQEDTDYRSDVASGWATMAKPTAVKGDYTLGSWASNKTSVAWDPSYALQGYPYAESVSTKCTSTVTGSTSGVTAVQGAQFITPMVQPPKPTWKVANLLNGSVGAKSGPETCRLYGSAVCDDKYDGDKAKTDSLVLNMGTVCASGGFVGWSVLDAQSWKSTTDVFVFSFGDREGWELGASEASEPVKYYNGQYTCNTLWAASPKSHLMTPVTFTINRTDGRPANG